MSSRKGKDALCVIDTYVYGLFILFVLVGIATFFRSYLFTLAGERIVLCLRTKLFESLIMRSPFLIRIKQGR